VAEKPGLAGIYKTAWFARAQRKARIADDDLCEAIDAVGRGKAADLGGGVYKVRLNRQRYRAVLLAKGRQTSVFAYLYAKQDRANIDDDELAGFRKLARAYDAMTSDELAHLLRAGDLTEICHDTAREVPLRRP
jgi:hypothetical protein